MYFLNVFVCCAVKDFIPAISILPYVIVFLQIWSLQVPFLIDFLTAFLQSYCSSTCWIFCQHIEKEFWVIRWVHWLLLIHRYLERKHSSSKETVSIILLSSGIQGHHTSQGYYIYGRGSIYMNATLYYIFINNWQERSWLVGSGTSLRWIYRWERGSVKGWRQKAIRNRNATFSTASSRMELECVTFLNRCRFSKHNIYCLK